MQAMKVYSFRLSPRAAESAGLARQPGDHYVAPQARGRLAEPSCYMSSRYSLDPQIKGGELHLHLNDVIDQLFGISAEHVQQALADADRDARVVMHINSLGGSVFDALAMRALLAEHDAGWEARIVQAASAAGLLALGADRRAIYESGRMMLHQATSMAWGSADDIEIAAKLLRGIDVDQVRDWAEASNKDVDEVEAMLRDETWLTAEEARDIGVVSAILSSVSPASARRPPSAAADREKLMADAVGAAAKIKL